MNIQKFPQLNKLTIYFILFLWNFPSLVWIFLDQRVWFWDQSHYAKGTLELYHALVNSPLSWLNAMISTYGAQAPAMGWWGQFFIPLGNLLGSTEIALLLSVFVTQFLVLVLIFHSINELTQKRTLIALVASLVVAAAPLYVSISHQFWAESIQTLAVSWFILIMSLSPKWEKKFVLVQLINASFFALLTKVSSPLYCLVPGLFILIYNFFPQVHSSLKNLQPENEARENSSPLKFYFWLFSGIILGLGTMTWYLKNWPLVKIHLMISDAWGEKQPFINTMIYWLSAVQHNHFLPSTSLLMLAVLGTGLVIYLFNGKNKLLYFDLCALVSLVSFVTFILVFSSKSNPDFRYSSPLLPHISLLIAWSLAQMKGEVISYFIALVLLIQLVIVHGKSLAITPFGVQAHAQQQALIPPERNPQKKQTIEKLVRVTCQDKNNLTNIIGFDISWLHINALNYFATKQNLHCNYQRLHDVTSPTETELDVWEKVLSPTVQYYIGVEPDLYNQEYIKPPESYNRFSLPILERVEKNVNFKIDNNLKPLGILLYRKQNDVSKSLTINPKKIRFIDQTKLPVSANTGVIDTVNTSFESEHRVSIGEAIRLEGWAILPEKNIPANQVIITVGEDNKVVGVADVTIRRPDVAKFFNKPQLTQVGWVAIIENIPDNYLPPSGGSINLKAWGYDAENKTAIPLNNGHKIMLK